MTATSTEWLPLSRLTQQDAESTEHAVLVGGNASITRLARAPLDRKGLVYELELGAARLNTVSGLRDFGFATRTGIGYFPTQTLGRLFADQTHLVRRV